MHTQSSRFVVVRGMTPLAALKTATSGNAGVLRLPDPGRIAPGLVGDVIAVTGDPTREIEALWKVTAAWTGGRRAK